ncbi:MAG: hypothetical protein ACR2IE_15985 [Candidatus Sumerlaeaceae bacterium]
MSCSLCVAGSSSCDFTYKPLEEHNEGGPDYEGLRIILVPIECHSVNSCHAESLDEIARPLIVDVIPPGTGKSVDRNPVSASGITLIARPILPELTKEEIDQSRRVPILGWLTGTATSSDEPVDRFDSTDSRIWKMPWTITVDLTSSTIEQYSYYSGVKRENIVAASVYAILITAGYNCQTTVTVNVIASPADKALLSLFNRDFHWDKKAFHVLEETIGGYVLNRDDNPGWLVQRKQSRATGQ